MLVVLGLLSTAELQSSTLKNYQLLEDAILFHWRSVDASRVQNQVRIVLPDGAIRADNVSAPGSNGSWIRARGIQYAEHPVGALRWQPPVPRAPWSGVVDATQFGDNCINAPTLTRLNQIGDASMSEACLSLNVWAPPLAVGDALLPVLVWFHGGSFVAGGSTHYGGDGLFAYRRDVVFVVCNYRLGAFGWLGGSHVAASSADGSAGNFGLQDTREVLRWVRRNIRGFGGDASRVTIAGESAGASLVETHLTARRSAGLFSQAVMQSGAFDNYTTQTDPDAGFAAFATLAGCPTEGPEALACLRATPLRASPGGGRQLMDAVANTSASGWFSPAIDGVELIETPEASAAAGRLNPVSAVLLGTNHDEGRLLYATRARPHARARARPHARSHARAHARARPVARCALRGGPIVACAPVCSGRMPASMPMANAPHSSDADLQAWLVANFGAAAAPPLRALYEDDVAAEGPWGAAAVAYTDGQYLCPTARSARWLERTGVASVYVYRLEYAPAFFATAGELLYWQEWCAGYARCANATAVPLRVGHGADVALLFHDPKLNATTDTAVARTLIDYWLGFVRSGDPNGGNGGGGGGGDPPLPHWPAARTNATMRLASPVPLVERRPIREQQCAFWDAEHPVPYPPPRDGARVVEEAAVVGPRDARRDVA